MFHLIPYGLKNESDKNLHYPNKKGLIPSSTMIHVTKKNSKKQGRRKNVANQFVNLHWESKTRCLSWTAGDTQNSNYRTANDNYLSLLFSFEGLVNKILSAGFWIPLSRLTYCAYLVHFIVMVVLLNPFETVQAYSDVHTVSNICFRLIVMNWHVFNVNVKYFFDLRFASVPWFN